LHGEPDRPLAEILQIEDAVLYLIDSQGIGELLLAPSREGSPPKFHQDRVLGRGNKKSQSLDLNRLLASESRSVEWFVGQ